MKALSERQSAACEGAATPASRCKCRCGGQFHGIKRGADRDFLECLPADDPHRIPTADERRDHHNRRRRELGREKRTGMRDMFAG